MPTRTEQYLDLEDGLAVEFRQTELRMLHADRIRKAMYAKEWDKKKLLSSSSADSLSTIDKWLSGTYNFDQNTLVEIGDLLDINFFTT